MSTKPAEPDPIREDMVRDHELTLLTLKRRRLQLALDGRKPKDLPDRIAALECLHQQESGRVLGFDQESEDHLEKAKPDSSKRRKNQPEEERQAAAETAERIRIEAEEQARIDAEETARKEQLGREDRERIRGELSGLAFSGGGIRSATFNLGILQALAGRNLLRRFDYLSTVSGGGYIGGWLTARLHRLNIDHQLKSCSGLEKKDNPPGLVRLEADLTDRSERSEARVDPCIQFLRRFSNYLTPKVGIMSADTWAVVANYGRNLLLNLVVLLAAASAILLVPRLMAGVVEWGGALALDTLDRRFAYPILILVTFGITSFPVYFLGKNLALFYPDPDKLKDMKIARDTQSRLLRFVIAPLVVASLAASIWIPVAASSNAFIPVMGFLHDLITFGGEWPVVAWSFWVAMIHLGMWAGIVVVAKLVFRSPENVLPGVRFLSTAIGSGLVLGPLLYPFAAWLYQATIVERLTLGPPILLVWLYLLAVLHTGLMSLDMEDFLREWLSRIGGWLMIVACAWLALFGIVLVGPLLVDLASTTVSSLLVSGWAVSTIAGLIAGRSGGDGKGASRRWIAMAAPYVFAVGLVILLASALHGGMLAASGYEGRYEQVLNHHSKLVAERATDCDECDLARLEALDNEIQDTRSDLWSAYLKDVRASHNLKGVLIAFLLAVAIAYGMSRKIDINEFSMHTFYRNRLVRAYLGASVNPEERRKKSQPFTSFYSRDDLELRTHSGSPNDKGIILTQPGPYHLVNGAINLAGGRELAWQQRKAASFLISPLFCGFLDAQQAAKFRPSGRFAKRPRPLTLGDAMTISGAAASPNMGFRTSTAFAFLMTIFNIRLGRWLGNPGKEQWRENGPKSSLGCLFFELFGIANDDRDFVYVSDGGHFENLGIYELVRRRCRYIVACDAGADPDLEMEDLGNAIRKCRSDFGVDIRIDASQIRERTDQGLSKWHCAVGEIRYDENTRGTLLYIKASMTGNEPEDIINYAAENPSFPHQSTADQFFEEAQFESYRRLGLHVGEAVFGPVDGSYAQDDPFDNQPLFRALSDYWYSPSSVSSEIFTRHAQTLDSVFDRLREADDLKFLSAQFYPEWDALVDGAGSDMPLRLPDDDTQRRKGFYFCNSLIQLMENVYMDLNLEDEYNHLDNRGWMNLFRHWSWSGMLRVTWAISGCTYGWRFQSFCKRHLKLDLGEVTLNRLPDGDLSSLNFLETAQVERYRDRESTATENVVVQFQLAVQGEQDVLLKFPVGYALLRRGVIRLFRIQDHLRRMGLARRSLLVLLTGETVDLNRDERDYRRASWARRVLADCQDHDRDTFDEFSEDNQDLFHRLFASALRVSHRNGT